jgi:hypothetical protein
VFQEEKLTSLQRRTRTLTATTLTSEGVLTAAVYGGQWHYTLENVWLKQPKIWFGQPNNLVDMAPTKHLVETNQIA